MNGRKYLLAGATCLLSGLTLMNAYAQQDEGRASEPYRPAACSTRVTAATSDVAKDPDIAPEVRKFLVEIDKDPSPFWTLPQPKPQDTLPALRNQTHGDFNHADMQVYRSRLRQAGGCN